MAAVIDIWVGQAESWWFGVACHGERLVATVVGADREDALQSLLRCLPRGRPHRAAEESAGYPRGIAAMLSRVEAGIEEPASCELCPDCVSEPQAAVLRAAARIPRGYATTYGRLAAVARTEARVVGRVIATNPLYPIVPCHRVVGADLSLVGYAGRQDPPALRAKLNRLRAESRGFTEERTLGEAGGLVVTPVEWVIRKAAHDGIDAGAQLSLW
jgi:O-6-methylguanine DNA methyltransferase